MPRPFAPPGTATHYVPDRPVAVSHVRLTFEPDLAARTLQGQSLLSLTSRQDGLDKVELNAVDMNIEQVTVDGKPVSGIDYDGERLRIPLGRIFARDERFSLAVDYRCTPRRGLYFVGPDQAHPDRPGRRREHARGQAAGCLDTVAAEDVVRDRAAAGRDRRAYRRPHGQSRHHA